MKTLMLFNTKINDGETHSCVSTLVSKKCVRYRCLVKLIMLCICVVIKITEPQARFCATWYSFWTPCFFLLKKQQQIFETEIILLFIILKNKPYYWFFSCQHKGIVPDYGEGTSNNIQCWSTCLSFTTPSLTLNFYSK